MTYMNNPFFIQAVITGIISAIIIVTIIILSVKQKKRSIHIASLSATIRALEGKIQSLTTTLETTQKQVDELIKAHDIVKKQCIVLIKMHASELKASQKKNSSKRKSDILPYFVFNGSSGNREMHKVKIKNKGQTAYNINITYPKSESIVFSETNNTIESVAKNFCFALEGKILNKVLQPQYEIRIDFEDEDKNKYYQLLSNIKTNKAAAVPVLVS